MKKLQILCMSMLISFAGYSQLEKGRIMVGADIGFSNQTNILTADSTGKERENEVTKSFDLGLRAGYFISDNTAVGLLFGFGTNSTVRHQYSGAPAYTTTTTNDFSGNDLSIGLFGRRYQMLGSSKFAVFGQLSAGFMTGKSENINTSPSGTTTATIRTTGTTTGFDLSLRPGIAYFLTNMVSVEATFGGLGYSMTTSKNYDRRDFLASTNKQSGFYTNMNLNLSSIWLGLTFYFGGSGSGSSTTTK